MNRHERQIFVPFYAIGLIISGFPCAHRPGVLVLPALAPITALLCNAFGTLTLVESIIVAELFIIGFLILRLALHLVRYESIQYSNKLNIAGTFRKRTRLALPQGNRHI